MWCTQDALHPEHVKDSSDLNICFVWVNNYEKTKLYVGPGMYFKFHLHLFISFSWLLETGRMGKRCSEDDYSAEKPQIPWNARIGGSDIH